MHTTLQRYLIAIGFTVLLAGCKSVPPPVAVFDPVNTTYEIDGTQVALVNGTATQAGTGATMTSTSVFGQAVGGDLNGDGVTDAAMMVVRNSGGSGAFYYVVAAINTAGAARGSNAVLLGDRIAPQNIEIRNGQIIANYADRNPGEPMTTPPSMGVSMYLVYDGSVLKKSSPVVGAGEHCGGNMTTAAMCGTGYHCAPQPGSHLPFGDVGGTCVAD